MADMYDSVAKKYGASAQVVFLFMASLAMLVIGVWLFAEDTVSSKLGFEQLQTHYQMNVQIFTNTYWVMSLAPQVASIVFFYIFLSDTSKKWALGVCMVFQGIDFYADTWYRSNTKLFTDWTVTAFAAAFTLIFFTVGSEMFISTGFGLVLKLFAPALQVFRTQMDAINKAWNRQHRPTYNTDTRPIHYETPKPGKNKPDAFRDVPGIDEFMPGSRH